MKGSAFLNIFDWNSQIWIWYLLHSKNSIYKAICKLVWMKARIYVGSVKWGSVWILSWWMLMVEFVAAYLLWSLGYFWVLVIVVSLFWLNYWVKFMIVDVYEDFCWFCLIQYENWWNVVCSGSKGWSLQYGSRSFMPVKFGVLIRGLKLPSSSGWKMRLGGCSSLLVAAGEREKVLAFYR